MVDQKLLLQKAGLVKKLKAELDRYEAKIKRSRLSSCTKEAYGSRLNNFLGYIALSTTDYSDFFEDSAIRQLAAEDYKRHMKKHLATPATVNSSLTAIDAFYKHMGFKKSKTKRERLPALAPRSLSKDEQRRLLVFADHSRPIDQAVIYLLLYTGIRLNECVSLNLSDIPITERTGVLIVRDGKGGEYREIPLVKEVRAALAPWMNLRSQRKGVRTDAFFLNPQNKRMSARSIDKIVRKLGLKCGIEISAHILRHSCLTNLARAKVDIISIGQIAGHRKIETTRRYTLASQDDLAESMKNVVVK